MEEDIKTKLIQSMIRLKKAMPHFNTEQNMQLTEVFALSRIQVEKENGITGAELQKALNINKSAVSQMLGTLENKGYIERKIDISDRRKISVYLTEPGDKALAKMKCFMDSFTTKVVDKFTPAKAELLTELFNEFSDILNDVFIEITNEMKGDTKE